MALGIRYNSPVVLTYALICTVVFFANQSMLNALSPFVSLGPSFNAANPLHYFNLVSYIVGHASLEHLMGNMTFILLLGPIIEEKYGSVNLFIMIILTAVVTAFLNISLFSTGLWGASGIVFMFIMLVSFTNVKEGQIPLTFILVALLFVGKEVLQSMGSDQVSQFAHILGGIVGSFFGFTGMFNKRAPEPVIVEQPIDNDINDLNDPWK